MYQNQEIQAGNLDKLLYYPPNTYNGNKIIGAKAADLLASGNNDPVNLKIKIMKYTPNPFPQRLIKTLMIAK